MALLCSFTQSLQSASAKVRKLSENHKRLAEKITKSDYFPLFNRVNGGISENSYKCFIQYWRDTNCCLYLMDKSRRVDEPFFCYLT